MSSLTTTSPLLSSSVFFDAPILTRRNAVKSRRSSRIDSLSIALDAFSGLPFEKDDTFPTNPIGDPTPSPDILDGIYLKPFDADELTHILQLLNVRTPAVSPVLSSGLGFDNCDGFTTSSMTSEVIESRGLPYDPEHTTSSPIDNLSSKLAFLFLFEGMRDSPDTPPLTISSPTGSAFTISYLEEDKVLPPSSTEGYALDEPFALALNPSDTVTSPFIRQGSDEFGFNLYCYYTFFSEEDRRRLANVNFSSRGVQDNRIVSLKSLSLTRFKERFSKAAKNVFTFGTRTVSPRTTRDNSWMD